MRGVHAAVGAHRNVHHPRQPGRGPGAQQLAVGAVPPYRPGAGVQHVHPLFVAVGRDGGGVYKLWGRGGRAGGAVGAPCWLKRMLECLVVGCRRAACWLAGSSETTPQVVPGTGAQWLPRHDKCACRLHTLPKHAHLVFSRAAAAPGLEHLPSDGAEPLDAAPAGSRAAACGLSEKHHTRVSGLPHPAWSSGRAPRWRVAGRALMAVAGG